MSGLMSIDLLQSRSFIFCFMQMQKELEDSALEVQVLQAKLDILAKSTTKAKKRIEQIQALNKQLYDLLNSIRKDKQALMKYCPDSIEPEEEPAEYGLMLEGVDDDPGREGNQSSSIYNDDQDSGDITPLSSNNEHNLNSADKSFQSMTLNDAIENGNMLKFLSLTKEDVARISKDFDETHTAKLEKAFERLLMSKISVGEVQDLDKGAPGSSTTAAHNHINAEPAVVAASSTAPTTKKKNKITKFNQSSNFDVNDVD